jgi:hypothetical protein
MVTVLGAGPPPQPPADFRVDLVGCRVWSLSSESLPQHPFAYLVELQGDLKPLGSGVGR